MRDKVEYDYNKNNNNFNKKHILDVECLFLFENEEIILFEIKRLDIESNATKSDKYFWLIFYKEIHDISKLHFVSASKTSINQRREFFEGVLVFDESKAILKTPQKTHSLKKSFPKISEDLALNIRNNIFNQN